MISARLIVDSTAKAIYGIDPQGICTFCNAAQTKYWQAAISPSSGIDLDILSDAISRDHMKTETSLEDPISVYSYWGDSMAQERQ